MDPIETRRASPQESEALLRRLLDEGIKPYTDDLAPILVAGDVAIVVFEPAKTDAEMMAALRAMGWDGKTPVFRMSNGYRKRLARNSDAVTAAWLMRRAKNVGRLSVWTGRANFLVNFTPGQGYSFEPGSLDSERV